MAQTKQRRTRTSGNAFAATTAAFVGLFLLACCGGSAFSCAAFRAASFGTGSSRRAATGGGEEEAPAPPASSSSSSYTIPENVVSNNALAEANGYPAIVLSPCLEAADPDYFNSGCIDGNADNDGDAFVVSRWGGPTAEELTSENLVRIVARRSNVTDLQVNTLAWKCLGYRFVTDDDDSNSNASNGRWTAQSVFPKWKERYPTPPDLIGMQRVYTKEIDGELIKNNQRLSVSVPLANKQSLKTLLKEPYGFSGYKMSELTPNLTRRAQVTNWLLYYREELFGVTLEELRERRRATQEREAGEERRAGATAGEQRETPWKPPIREVY